MKIENAPARRSPTARLDPIIGGPYTEPSQMEYMVDCCMIVVGNVIIWSFILACMLHYAVVGFAPE